MFNEDEPDDNAVLSGIEIARCVTDSIREQGWGKTWSDCDGFRISRRVRVWLDGYSDRDFEHLYLLRVWTDTEPDADGWTATVTDHLAVLHSHARDSIDAEWRQDPRLFFDADLEWEHDGLVWWADWSQTLYELKFAETRRPGSVVEHNSKVSRGERDKARRMGLASTLPYLTTIDAEETE